jgi:hypothetical protein
VYSARWEVDWNHCIFWLALKFTLFSNFPCSFHEKLTEDSKEGQETYI